MYDVALVGARAAGAATALLLARAGLGVLLVDRGQYGSDTMSTHALMRGGVLQLTRWGLLDAVIAADTPPVKRTTFRYANDVVTVEIQPSFGVDALYAPRRTVLDRLLVDAATAAGVDTRFRSAVTHLCRDRDGTVNGVAGRSRDGASFKFAARIVVGADGIRSSVAALVDARARQGRRSEQHRGHLRVLDAAPDERLRMGLPPTSSIRVHPHERRKDLCVRQRATRAHRPWRPRTTDPGCCRLLTRARGPSRGRDPTRRVPHLPRPTGIHPPVVGPRLGTGGRCRVLQGSDHCARPHRCTARCRAARRAILEVFAGADDSEALARYQATRDALSADLFDVTDIIAGYRWTDAEIGDLLIRLSRAMSAEVTALAGLPSLQLSPR